MGLETYHAKRDFSRTPEPRGKVSGTGRRRFVVQEHHASKLHFDFRLEMGGVLKSWSVPKGPSLDPRDKRFAAPTEDHPVEYLKFEGQIPEGNYGAGEHLIWDAGTYRVSAGEDPLRLLEAGRLKFILNGEKLHGEFNLVRVGKGGDRWLLIKGRDEFAEPGWKLELRFKPAGGEERGKGRAKEAAGPVKKEVRKYSTKAETTAAVPASRAFRSGELTGDVRIKVGEEIVALSNLGKVYWEDEGYTKGDLIRYYYEVSKYILPYLKDRALIMKRYPNGIRGKFFHQHDVDEVPDFVRTASLKVEDGGGHVVDYIVGDNLPTLLYMANLGAIERHPWHSRLRNLDRPDWFVFDLDPAEGTPYPTVCDLALGVKDVLERLGFESYAKTSGSRGMHIYVPIKPLYAYEEIAKFAERVATLVANEHPKIATVERALKNRKKGRIYLDHMQNARGKSVVAPYSVRPQPGATISAPLDWHEVEGKRISTQDFTIKSVPRRIADMGDIFKSVLSHRQRLDGALDELDRLSKRK